MQKLKAARPSVGAPLTRERRAELIHAAKKARAKLMVRVESSKLDETGSPILKPVPSCFGLLDVGRALFKPPSAHPDDPGDPLFDGPGIGLFFRLIQLLTLVSLVIFAVSIPTSLELARCEYGPWVDSAGPLTATAWGFLLSAANRDTAISRFHAVVEANKIDVTHSQLVSIVHNNVTTSNQQFIRLVTDIRSRHIAAC